MAAPDTDPPVPPAVPDRDRASGAYPASKASHAHSAARHGRDVREHAPAYGKSPAREKHAVGIPRNANGQNACILVVDDDKPILDLIRLILQSGGYPCITAQSGGEAISLFQEKQASVRLLITDLTMPGIDGAALIHALREIDPALPCIGMSGSDTGCDVDLWRGQQIVHVEKPFTTRDLLGAVAQLFSRAA